jgi:uncharacterized membrane protein (DUF4010 family)
VAGAISCLRTVVLAMLATPSVGVALAPALVGAALAMALPALLPGRGSRGEATAELPANPFEFLEVLKMAFLLAGIALLAGLASQWLGAAALLGVAAVSGLADVDAVTLSVVQLVPGSISATLAATAIALAVASNIVAKSAYALSLGGRSYGLRVALASLGGLVVGGVVMLLF